MKTFAIIVLAISAMGCTVVDRQTHYGDTSAAITPALPVTETPSPFPSTQPNLGPQLIVPLTEGPPIIGIPVGGNLYMPVTGGAPVTGIPTSP